MLSATSGLVNKSSPPPAIATSTFFKSAIISLSFAKPCKWLTRIILLIPRASKASTCLLISAAVPGISVVVNLVVPGEEIVRSSGVTALTIPNRAPEALSRCIYVSPTFLPVYEPRRIGSDLRAIGEISALAEKSKFPEMNG